MISQHYWGGIFDSFSEPSRPTSPSDGLSFKTLKQEYIDALNFNIAAKHSDGTPVLEGEDLTKTQVKKNNF